MSREAAYICSSRDMHVSNLLTTCFLAMLFIMLPNNRFYWTHTGHNGLSISLIGNQVNRVNFVNRQNFRVVKNGSFMRNKGRFLCPYIYGQQKYR